MATLNALFAIVNVSNPVKMETVLKSLPNRAILKLSTGEWLVYAPGSTTSKELSDQLGLGVDSLAMVLKVESYFGHNYQHVWDWIQTKQGAELGTTTVTAI